MATNDCTRSASELANVLTVRNVNLGSKGLCLKPKWLTECDFVQNNEVSVLFLPGHVVLTNQPKKQQCLQAIEELQHRQFELGKDFSEAIQQLAANIHQ